MGLSWLPRFRLVARSGVRIDREWDNRKQSHCIGHPSAADLSGCTLQRVQAVVPRTALLPF
jgi:hypothetical protein